MFNLKLYSILRRMKNVSPNFTTIVKTPRNNKLKDKLWKLQTLEELYCLILIIPIFLYLIVLLEMTNNV